MGGSYSSANAASRSPAGSPSFRPQENSSSLFKTPAAGSTSGASDSKPLLNNHSRFKRKIEPGIATVKDETGSVKRRQSAFGPNVSSAGPNVSSAGRKTIDASKIKNLSRVKFKKEEPKEEKAEEEEEEEEMGEDDEEEAVSVTKMFSSQFGKEDND